MSTGVVTNARHIQTFSVTTVHAIFVNNTELNGQWNVLSRSLFSVLNVKKKRKHHSVQNEHVETLVYKILLQKAWVTEFIFHFWSNQQELYCRTDEAL
jgi:hypothetical protein